MTNLNLFKRVTTAYDLERMRRSRIVGAGCGGARQYYEDMARAGVGQFVITDPDVAEESNISDGLRWTASQTAFSRLTLASMLWSTRNRWMRLTMRNLLS